MSLLLLIVQTLNGLQFGVLLFLIAAGLTLVFGVMDFINLAHGVQYMLGAYFAVMFYALTGSFVLALLLALLASLAFGLLLEFAIFRHLYERDHLEQVIATFGIILFLNEGVKVVWGASPLSLPVPEALGGSVVLMPGLLYPVWRIVIIVSGLAVALLLYVLVTWTRVGMLVRAGASNARILLWKEIRVALINGLLIGGIVGIIAFAWFRSPLLSLVIAMALVLNFCAAATAGVLLPLLLKRMNIDPAVAGTVVVTAVTDVMGFFCFLGLATLILLH